MAYTGIIATEAELDAMAGENVDTTGWTEANKNLWMLQVEGFLSAAVQYDVATNWASLDGVTKTILSEYTARYCAMAGIAYNMAGFTTREEAENMINIHAFRMTAIEGMLRSGPILKQIGVA